MDDVLASRFGKTRARRRFQNEKMRRTRREHAWCCPTVVRWLGWVTQGCKGMLQESQTEEESQVTIIELTRLAELTGLTDRVTQDGRGNRVNQVDQVSRVKRLGYSGQLG
jgi:hypothetical protein